MGSRVRVPSGPPTNRESPHKETLFFMEKYFVYILQSELDGSYYVGSTQNVEVRLMDHNAGRGRYTQKKVPWNLVHKEEYNSKTEALKREKFIKNRSPGFSSNRLFRINPEYMPVIPIFRDGFESRPDRQLIESLPTRRLFFLWRNISFTYYSLNWMAVTM